MKLTSDELTSVCPDPIIGVDSAGIISVFNPAAEKLLGYQAINVIGKLSITEVYEQKREARKIKKMLMTESHGSVGQIEGYETRIITRDGTICPIRLSATLLATSNETVHSIGFFHDLTSRQELEEELLELSRTDHLTGMYNSRQFHLALDIEIKRSKRYRHPFSLICIDLDNLKQINDFLGHMEGDEVLKLVGIVTRDTLRENDSGYRYGGDEFMVICPETGYAGAVEVAERLRNAFSQLLPRVIDLTSDEIDGAVSMSIGVTVYYGGNDVGIGELIQQADLTMYRSKMSGGNQVTRFEAEMRPGF